MKENRYYKRNKDILLEAKNKPCSDCGQQFPPYVMQFDHLPKHEKLFTPGNVGTRSVRSILQELNKCEVVCANCHIIRSWNRGSFGRNPHIPHSIL